MHVYIYIYMYTYTYICTCNNYIFVYNKNFTYNITYIIPDMHIYIYSIKRTFELKKGILYNKDCFFSLILF